MYTTLITAADLAGHIDDPRWVVLDCRHDLANLEAGREGYAIGHVPGAQFVALESDLSGAKRAPDGAFRGRHPLPERSAFIATLRGWGIHPDTQVVAYDAHGGMFAARLWWMLRWVGHSAVAVLDGGLAAWQAQGLPMSIDVPQREPGTVTEQTALGVTVSASDVLNNLPGGDKVVIDARAADRFRGCEDILDRVRRNELEAFACLGREVGEVGFVLAGDDHALQSGALGREHLLAQAADR